MTDLAMNREDLAANYFARRGDREFQAALKRLELRRSAEKAAETGGEAAVVGPRDVKGEAVERLKTGGRIALDVAHGIVEAPIQIPAGAIDAVNTSIDAVYEVSDWVRANSAPSDEIAASPEADLAAKAMPAFAGVLKKGSGQVADTPPEARLQLPIPADADSVTGGMIRGISRFVVGFAGAGKITKGVKAATATGKAAIAAGRGAMSDAAVFSAHEERLSDLVNQFPALQNPVTEYLASNPEDSAAEGRFKNALEGLIPGIAVDGLMLGLRAIRAGRAANVSMAAAPAKDLTPTFTREEVDALLSDRPKPKPEVVPAEGPLTPEQAAKAGQKAEPITAHHGTGAKFEPEPGAPLGRFKREHIGEGEGAAAYGYGFYFAENPGVAGDYRRRMSPGRGIEAEDTVARILNEGLSKEDAIAEVRSRANRSDDPDFKAKMEQAEQIIRDGSYQGYTYTVNLHVRPEEMLDWDLPLSEQSPQVREALSRLVASHQQLNVKPATLEFAEDVFADVLGTKPELDIESGGEFYRLLERKIGGREAASRAMAEAGIPGLRYLDQGSRARTGGKLVEGFPRQEDGKWKARVVVRDRDGTDMFTTSQPFDTEAEARQWAAEATDQGTRNLVMFDESRIEITARNGELIPPEEAAGVVDDMLPSGGTSALEVDEGEVYVNWARIDTDKDVKALIRDMADAEKGEIDEATRGVVSNQETIENAAREDAWKLITERRKGEPLNAEQSFAVRKLWTASGEKLKELAELASTNPSDLNLFAFRRQMALHSTIQRQVIAARTETARALQQWAIPAGSDSEMARALGEIVEGMGGGEAVSRNMAEKVAKYARSGDLEKMEKFIEASAWAKTQDAVSSAWYFSLLSGPHTHMRNMVSNTVVAAQQIYERKAANLIGQMLGQENVARGEGMAQIAGTIEGIKDALRITSQNGRLNFEGTFYESMRTGQAGIGIGKLETPPAGAFSSEKWALDPESMEGRFMDMLDTVMSVPGRALMAEDELFKTIGYRRELHAQVHRKVRGEIDQGVLESTPEAIKDRTAELLADPDETLRLAAMDEAMYTTFTGQVGRAGKAFNQAANSIPVLGRIILPFRRTPVNIARYGFERTPLAPAVRQWREDIAAGGARRDIAMARMATGSALLLAMADLAVGGHIVGEGPDDPAQRATMRRQGVQPNSVRVKTGPGEDDYRYFSYRGMEPMAQTIGIAANIVEILKYTDWTEENSEVDELIVAAGMAIAYQSTSATYLTGMSDFFDAMGDPRRYGEKWFMRLAGSAVPTGVAQINRIADPNMRAVEDMIDAIKRRTPGLSKDLPYARDAWGKPIKYQSGIGSLYDAISPSYSKAYKPEPIDKELERLELWIGKPSKRVHFGAELLGSAAPLGIERSSTAVDLAQYPKAYDRYVELQGHAMSENIHGAPIDISGKGLLGTLNDLVEGRHPMSKLYHDYMTDGPEGGKAEEILTIRRKFQAAAREQILEEFPELREEVLGRLRKQQRSF